MKKQKFGGNGPQVPVIGQGTWYIDRGDRQAAIAALRRGVDLGMTHIDTAEMYGDAELVIADAIAGNRDDVFLVSKVLPSNASRRGTIAACERSLKRLKTDHLDCYLLHWRGSYSLEDTVAAFDELIAAGKIASWGVSNFDETDLEEAWRLGDGRVTCNQVGDAERNQGRHPVDGLCDPGRFVHIENPCLADELGGVLNQRGRRPRHRPAHDCCRSRRIRIVDPVV